MAAFENILPNETQQSQFCRDTSNEEHGHDEGSYESNESEPHSPTACNSENYEVLQLMRSLREETGNNKGTPSCTGTVNNQSSRQTPLRTRRTGQRCSQSQKSSFAVDKNRLRRSNGVVLFSNPVEHINDLDNSLPPGDFCSVPGDVRSNQQQRKQSKQCKSHSKKLKKNSFWTDAQMRAAVAAHEQGASMRSAALHHGIPQSTFQSWCYGVQKSRKRGVPTVLTVEEEAELVRYLLGMCDRGLGLTPSLLKLKVYEITRTRMTPFTNGVPSDGWLRCFKRRHPELALRVAQPLSSSRAKSLCQENVQSFYDNLRDLYTLHSYPPNRVWNCDETGVQAGRNGGAIVIGRRGARHVHLNVPDQREWLSVLVCINAGGSAIPSFYIFKGMRFRQNYIEHCEPGATMAMQPRAWMTSYLFSAWISHFIQGVAELGGISPTQRHLLILDGHGSHVTLVVAMAAKEAGLDIVTLPSHTSHALQPLDVCVFGPFKTYFRQYRDYWVSRNLNQPATKHILAHWVSLSLKHALTVNNITKGFSCTGIYPLDRTAVDSELGPSEPYVCRDQGGEGATAGSNSARGNNFETATRVENIPALVDEDIEDNFQLPPNSSTAHYFVDAGMSTAEVELHVETPIAEGAEEVAIVDPDTNPQSITRFLQLPTITERSNPRRRNVDPIVDFSKSIMLTSEAYMTTVQQMQEQNLQRARDKETARILRQEAQQKKHQEQEARRLEREAHHQQVVLERTRKAENQARKAAERARKAQEREEIARQRGVGRASRGAGSTCHGEEAAGPSQPREEAVGLMQPQEEAQPGANPTGSVRREPNLDAQSQAPLSLASLQNSNFMQGSQFLFGNPFQTFVTPVQSMLQSPQATVMPNVTHFQQFPMPYPMQTTWPLQQSVGERQ